MVNSIGVVIWFDNVKGFGMLETPTGQLTFIHIKSFKTRPESIREKQVVIFAGKPDPKRQRAEATSSRLLTEAADWPLVMHYLGKDDTVFLRDNHRQQQGTAQKGSDKNKQNLMQLASIQLFNAVGEDELLTMLTDYFDYHLNDEHFVDYCKFLQQVIVRTAGDENGNKLLDQIFRHFGEHLDAAILFTTWKNRKFAYIGYPDAGDYEIPDSVLMQFPDNIGADELLRIRQYECAPAFFQYIVPAKIKEPDNLNEAEISILYESLELLNMEEQQQYKPILQELYQQKA